MSPSKFYSNDQQQPQVKKEMNATRPPPLKINRDSHLIQKSSSNSSSSNSSSNSNSISISNSKNNRPPTHQQQQQRHPVIIYTHSPKIIHTKARDFMALVQKLTGMSRSEEDDGAMQRQDGKKKKAVGQDDSTTSSSVVTDENCGGGGVQVNSTSISPGFNQVPNPYLSDLPLLAQNSSDFCCSSRPLYRYPDHIFSSPALGNNTISPSVLEVLKGYPDYCN